MIRVVNVKGLRTPEQRAGVVYVGRAFAGWPWSRYGNPYKPRPGFDAVTAYRNWFLGHATEAVENALAELWTDTEHGAKPLGCWCVEATAGDGSPVVCHAQVIAELLRERFGQPQLTTPATGRAKGA